jgi:hypothetical protein
MRVANLISDLQRLNPDDEVVVAYWTRDLADQYVEDRTPLTDEQWQEIVNEVGSENIQFQEVGDLIEQLAYEKTESLEE